MPQKQKRTELLVLKLNVPVINRPHLSSFLVSNGAGTTVAEIANLGRDFLVVRVHDSGSEDI